MSILSLLASSSYITVNKQIIKAFNTDTAVILGHLCSCQIYHKDWFFQTFEKIEIETGIKVYSIRKVIQNLIKNNILNTRKKGSPCKVFYKINEVELLQNILSDPTNSIGLDPKKTGGLDPTNSIGLYNNNTYNNNTKESIINNTLKGPKASVQNKIKYNGILNRTLIKIAGFKTKINNDTKTMQSVYKFLNELQHNKFLSNNKFTAPALNKLNIKKDCFRINRIMTDKQLENVLIRACKEWKRMQEDSDCWKPNKAPSLDAFFYNKITGMSWFLYCFCGLVSETREYKTTQMLDNVIKSAEKIDKNFLEYCSYLYNQDMIKYKKWNDNDKLKFFSTAKSLLVWREENKEALKKLNGGYDIALGNNKYMFKTVSKFLEDKFPNPFPMFLIPESTNWKLFETYCLECFNSRIDV